VPSACRRPSATGRGRTPRRNRFGTNQRERRQEAEGGLVAPSLRHEEQRASAGAEFARRAKREPCRCPRGRRAGDLVPMPGVASDARRATPAARPSGRVSGVRGDAYCLPKQQRSFGWRRIAAAAQIRPTQQRTGPPSGAPGLLLCQEAGVSPCAPGRRPTRSSAAQPTRRSQPPRKRMSQPGPLGDHHSWSVSRPGQRRCVRRESPLGVERLRRADRARVRRSRLDATTVLV
jgi:hypothetical protein